MTTMQNESTAEIAAKDLVRMLELKSFDRSTVYSLFAVLPELLEAFILKYAHHRTVSSDIVEHCKKEYLSIVEGVHHGSLLSAEKQPLDDIMDLWHSHQPSLVDEEDNGLESKESAEADVKHKKLSENDLRDSDAVLTAAERAVYQSVDLNGDIYQWLLLRARREMLLASGDSKSSVSIRRMISASRPKPDRISKDQATRTQHMAFRLDWGPTAFLLEQGADAQALSCGEYLQQMWPWVADQILHLVKRMVARPNTRHNCILQDRARIRVRLHNSMVTVNVWGPTCTIVEVSEAFTWLSAALRSSPFETGIAICLPVIREVRMQKRFDRNVLMKKKFAQDINTFMCTLEMQLQPHTAASETSNCMCWYSLFKNPVVVGGCPIPRGVDRRTGRELPLGLMAELVGTRKLKQFNGKLFIKGFSAMLIPVGQNGNILLWHLAFDRSGNLISYLHRTDEHLASLDQAYVEGARHILGWCKEARYYAG
ncbi:hypothetical protein LTR84_004004 [Exophiala bonariae]|uniref:Uncharacterized protein n=1 Tax=Exophiala bonariae TaxID=1690606 RepID=A0AAV9N552_9EURO|nr:hypothetical protein LTR84_004004 [Exophiala bonariae]